MEKLTKFDIDDVMPGQLGIDRLAEKEMSGKDLSVSDMAKLILDTAKNGAIKTRNRRRKNGT